MATRITFPSTITIFARKHGGDLIQVSNLSSFQGTAMVYAGVDVSPCFVPTGEVIACIKGMKKKYPEDQYQYEYGEEVTMELQDDGKWVVPLN